MRWHVVPKRIFWNAPMGCGVDYSSREQFLAEVESSNPETNRDVISFNLIHELSSNKMDSDLEKDSWLESKA
jgi:hypothetical protein